jgi:hypothetical protein
MRRSLWVLGGLAVALLAATGCQNKNLFYKRPDIEGLYAKVTVDMTRADVIKICGEPTVIRDSEMFYIYDDPTRPVRLRFVLDDQDVVVEKYYESKQELAKRAEVMRGQAPTTKPITPGEEPRSYPGGPLDRFNKPVNEP